MKIPFSALPLAVRESLVAATSSPAAPEDHVVISTETIRWKRVAAVFGALVVLGLVAFAAIENSRWREGETVALAAGIAVGALIFVSFFYRARAVEKSPVKPALIFTPIIAAKTGLDRDPVEIYYLKDLSNTDIVHHSTNGVYTHTTFDLTFQGGRLTFGVSPKAKAEGLIEFLRSGPDRVRKWIAEGSAAAKIASFDWIAGAHGPSQSGAAPDRPDAEAPFARSIFERSRLARLALVAAITAAATGIARSAHEIRYEASLWDIVRSLDTPEEYRFYLASTRLGKHREEAEERLVARSWELAEKNGKASAYRKFRADFPKAPQAEQARERLYKLYAEAEERYLATAKNAIPEAGKGMKALLARLRDKGDPIVWVNFMPAEGLEGAAIERAISKATGSPNVEPVGPSFTPERNRTREGRIVRAMRASFGKIFSDDLFELKEAHKAEPGPRFLVRYKVVGAGEDDYYYSRSEESLPLAQRRLFVGIAIDFDFTLQVTEEDQIAEDDPTKGHRFFMRAVPAPNFTVYGSASAGRAAVYDKMADTAFEQFEKGLANAYGVGVAAPPETVPASDTEGAEDR
jgi:hypothetical protein